MKQLAISFIYTGITIFVSDFITHLFLNDLISNLVTIILAIATLYLTTFSVKRKELEDDVNELINDIYG